MELPDAIRCQSCEKSLLQARFSNKQLQKYQAALTSLPPHKRNTTTSILPYCRPCNGEPRTEMYCIGCDKTMALNKFSEAQRRKPEARCLYCAQEREDFVPDVKDAVAEEQIYDEITTHGGVSAWSMRSMGASNTGGSRAAVSHASNSAPQSSVSNSDQVWIQEESRATNTSRWAKKPRAGTQMSAGHGSVAGADDDETETMMGAMSTTSGRSNGPSGVGWQPIENSYRDRQASQAIRGSRNQGFASQGAVKETAEQRAVNRAWREKTKAEQQQDDEEEEPPSDDDESDWEL